MALIHLGAPTFLLLVGILVMFFLNAFIGLIIVGVAIIAFIAVFLMGAAILGTHDHHETTVEHVH
jgi:hypothetical protein